MNKTILRDLGLTDYEVEIFLALTKNGPLSVYEISKKTGLYRQACYDALNRLQEKGFVNFVLKNNRKIFQAIDPKLILEFLNEKTENYKQILPELIQVNEASKQPLAVETYKGKNVVRIALRDIINALKKEGGEVLCTAVDESVPFVQHRTICDQYERDMLYYGIKERVIIREGTNGIFLKGTSRYKQIPEKFFNPNPTQIYGDNVQVIIWGNPDHLIIVRNKDVADSYRKQFELMWGIAEKK